MNLARQGLNLYTYSSCHIALGAVLFTSEAYNYIEGGWDLLYLSFVFCSTVLIYSIHRIVGIRKLSSFSTEGRFQVISQYQDHIKVYIGVSLISMLYLMSQLSAVVVVALVPVGIISFLYTLPLFSKKKRLRDFHYIKILLISYVWAYIATLPLWLDGGTIGGLWLYFMEKFVFILAITLPFDIRDLEIDSYTDLMTIPKRIGVKRTYALCMALLAIGLGIQIYVAYPLMELVFPIGIVYVLTALAIIISRGKRSDLYYSGMLDGTLVLRGIVLWLGLSG